MDRWEAGLVLRKVVRISFSFDPEGGLRELSVFRNAGPGVELSPILLGDSLGGGLVLIPARGEEHAAPACAENEIAPVIPVEVGALKGAAGQAEGQGS
jgi:hypothetical protein